LQSEVVIKLSILIPTYNPHDVWLKEAIESVCAQSYPHWELCIADDASTDPEVREVLEEYSRRDPRIKVCFREVNGHISNASNSALEMATWDWIMLMDHDDLIPSNALQEFADVIQSHPDVKMIYSDEDKISSDGKRYFPNLKPDWNQDLFLSCNVISHLTAYRSDLLREIGGFRVGYEGAQDYDLTLRYVKKIKPSEIHHIPKVLYHWRCHEGSTASSGGAKPYAIEAGKKALSDYLTGSTPDCHVEEVDWGAFSVVYDTPITPSDILYVVSSDGNEVALKRCIASLQKTAPDVSLRVAILPISSDGHQKLQKCFLPEGVSLVELPAGMTAAESLNLMISSVEEKVICFLSDSLDCKSKNWIREMSSHAMRNDIGAVGGGIYYPDGRVRSAGLILDEDRICTNAFHHWSGDSWGYMGRLTLLQNYSAVSGKCLVVEREKFLKVGGFDIKNLSSNFLDVDLCLRLGDAGYRTLWTPKAKFTDHSPRFSLKEVLRRYSRDYQKDHQWMRDRWRDRLKKDPAYNPNLNQKKKDFNYRWPPKENE
jgi:glycosyltransferase involved in cell wall biosynthesis